MVEVVVEGVGEGCWGRGGSGSFGGFGDGSGKVVGVVVEVVGEG